MNNSSRAAIAPSSVSQDSGKSQHIFPEHSTPVPSHSVAQGGLELSSLSPYAGGDSGFQTQTANKIQLSLIAERPQLIIKSRKGWACKHCGCDSGRVGAGAGPHAARLDCAGCGVFVQWIGKKAFEKIQKEAV